MLPTLGPCLSTMAMWTTAIRPMATMSVRCVVAREYWLFDYFILYVISLQTNKAGVLSSTRYQGSKYKILDRII